MVKVGYIVVGSEVEDDIGYRGVHGSVWTGFRRIRSPNRMLRF